MDYQLNEIALQIAEDISESPEDLRVRRVEQDRCGQLFDFGIEAEGGLEAGIVMAAVCMANLAEIHVNPGQLAGLPWPEVVVQTDFPVPACLFSQYAGWKLSVGKYFAMASGPMRAVSAEEPLFDKLWYREEASEVIGVLETNHYPTREVYELIAEQCEVDVDDVTLLVAPTASMAGNVQVVARSVETALHKLYELGFDVTRIRSAHGVAPLPPVAPSDMEGIGRTNDAILYGGRVTLWVRGDDASIAEVVNKVPSSSSAVYGKPFLKIFEEAGRDFYKIDPLLFSPAQVVFQNLDTGRVHAAGQVNESLLKQSFGLA